MRASMREARENSRTSVAVSIAAHVVLVALIASITFHYPLSAFFSSKDRTVHERIQFVQAMPQPSGGGGSSAPAKKKATPATKPPPLVAPVAVPTEIPAVPDSSANVGATSGSGDGSGGAGTGTGFATGVSPSLPDPRIILHPDNRRVPTTMTQAQRNDSAVKAIYMAYREAAIAAEEARGRNPRDWTVERNGQKYGIDSQFVYLGKFKLPSAILAALPLNFGGVDGRRIIDNRNASWIQNDIYMHSQGLSEDDFRAAVKRIRERKDRERKQAEDRSKGGVP